MTYVYIKTQKGKDAILLDNYVYHHGRDNKKTVYYKCRKPGCKASVTVKAMEREIVTLKDDHFGHKKFEEVDNVVTDCLKRMKMRAKTELSVELLIDLSC
jgi:hypothetical protein